MTTLSWFTKSILEVVRISFGRAFALAALICLTSCSVDSNGENSSSMSLADIRALEAATGEDGKLNMKILEVNHPETAEKIKSTMKAPNNEALILPAGLPQPPALLKPSKALAGTRWPDLTLLESADDLEAARSGWVVINYWADWCAPCVAELPDIEKANKLLAETDISIVTVQADTSKGKGRETAEAVFAKRGVTLLSLTSAVDKKSAKLLLTQSGNPIGALPFNVIYAPDGQPVGVFSGGSTDGKDLWSSEAGLAWLKALPSSGL